MLFDDVLVEPFMSDGAVVALDIGILLRLSGRDVAQGNSLRFGSSNQFATDIFRSIIHTNGERFAAPLDDLVQTADDAFSRQRKIHLDGWQAVAIGRLRSGRSGHWIADCIGASPCQRPRDQCRHSGIASGQPQAGAR
jgi:hypothetical protein